MAKTFVMVNGAGKMARAASEAIIKSSDFKLFPFSFVGKNTKSDYEILGEKIRPIPAKYRESFLKGMENSDLLVTDCTVPSAVNENAEVYCIHNLPFTMMTTGGDSEGLEKLITNSNIPAVVAPNMAEEVVAFQSVISELADEYTGTWEKNNGDGLYLRESHQGVDVCEEFKGKKDTSGTAKAMVKYFQKIGVPFEVSDIVKIRDMEDQEKLGVPLSALKGHGWHRYKLYAFNNRNQGITSDIFYNVGNFIKSNPVFKSYITDNSKLSRHASDGVARVSPDGNVLFRVEKRLGEVKIDHNINHRTVYANGNLNALRHLDQAVEKGRRGKMYDMSDVTNKRF